MYDNFAIKNISHDWILILSNQISYDLNASQKQTFEY